ncbi:MAG: helix-turn-helix transcriptional regulator [Proteobacteria bacterium]|jgi:DNA-binding transcriptional regulator YiaG|nr:helix-turn-helix transcriptional regulator [Pseudomonadota bacterium]
MDKWAPEKIKDLRKEMDLTQKDFGDRIGVTREYVNKLEKGVRRPGKTMCILLDCIEQKGRKKRKESVKHGKRDL